MKSLLFIITSLLAVVSGELSPTIDYCPFDSNVKIETMKDNKITSSDTGYTCATYSGSNDIDPDAFIQSFMISPSEYELGNVTIQIPIHGFNSVNQNRNLAALPELTNQLIHFTDCHRTSETEIVNFNMGIIISFNLFKSLDNNTVKALRYIEDVFKHANRVYVDQFSVKLHIDHVIIDIDDKSTWENPECSLTIFEQFDIFANAPVPSRQGIWHLFEICDTTSNAIGVAFVGMSCDGNFGRGYTTIGRSSGWTTMAHENGHNFGGQHIPDGIMSSGGSKYYEGKIQFNPKSKDTICGTMETMMDCDEVDYNIKWSYEATCGNGIVEINEECECSKNQLECECCKDCKLKNTAQCDPLHNECCNSDCSFRDTRSICFTLGSLGYCNNGYCELSFCNIIGGESEYCGTHDDNSCKIKCRLNKQSSCILLNGWTIGGQPFNHLPDGTLCRDDNIDYGVCNDGKCYSVDKPTPAPTPKPTPDPTPEPIGEIVYANFKKQVINNLCDVRDNGDKPIIRFKQVFDDIDLVIECNSQEYILDKKSLKKPQKINKKKSKEVGSIMMKSNSELELTFKFVKTGGNSKVNIDSLWFHVFDMSDKNEQIDLGSTPECMDLGSNIQQIGSNSVRSISNTKRAIPKNPEKLKDKHQKVAAVFEYTNVDSISLKYIQGTPGSGDPECCQQPFYFAFSSILK